MAYVLLGGLDPASFDQSTAYTYNNAYADTAYGFARSSTVTKITIRLDISSASSTAFDVGFCDIGSGVYTPRGYVTVNPYAKAGNQSGEHTLSFESALGDFTAFAVTAGQFIIVDSNTGTSGCAVGRSNTASPRGYRWSSGNPDVFPTYIDTELSTSSSSASALEVAFFDGSEAAAVYVASRSKIVKANLATVDGVAVANADSIDKVDYEA
jgi:hypothetical protein